MKFEHIWIDGMLYLIPVEDDDEPDGPPPPPWVTVVLVALTLVGLVALGWTIWSAR